MVLLSTSSARNSAGWTDGKKYMDTCLDVIVVGAGAAGIGAASTLRAAGLESYVVLEASQSSGGRVRTFRFGDAATPPTRQLWLEAGANWVSGAGLGSGARWPHKEVNPLFSLALRLNMSMVQVPGSATNMTNWGAAGTDGKWADEDGARRERANKLKGCVSRISGTSRLTAAAAAAACGWNFTDGLDRALLWQLFTGETGAPPDQMLASGYMPDPTYEDFGPDDFFVKDATASNPRGFARVLDAVADGLLDGSHKPALGGGRLVLGADVDSVAYTCEGVVVTAADGRSWRARHLISTLPLGVLQRRAAAQPPGRLFAPPVPPAQRAAMRQIRMTNYTKIFAQWEAPWWDTSVYKWAQANEGFNGGELGSVRNLAHPSVYPGSSTLLFDLGDPQASEWEGLSDAAARSRLVRRLREHHVNVSIPEPVAFHITRHSRDPLSYGAYSAWGLSSDADHVLAAAPLAASARCAPRVWLSGEAFCRNYNGFVHGGLFAGRRDARRVLRALGKPTPRELYLPGEEVSIGCDVDAGHRRW